MNRLFNTVVDVVAGGEGALHEAKKQVLESAVSPVVGPLKDKQLDSLVHAIDNVDRAISDKLIKGFNKAKSHLRSRHVSTLPYKEVFEGPGFKAETINPGLPHSKSNKLVKMVTGNGPRKSKKNASLATVASAPPSLGFRYTNSPPKLRMSSDGESCTYTHMEPFPHIQSHSTDFQISSVDVNPGLQTFSRWLPGIASRFEYYQFKSLEIIYEPAVGTTRDGNICVCFDPDQFDPSPSDVETMLYMQDSQVGTPWAPFVLSVSKKNLYQRKTFRVRTADLPVDSSPELYDIGTIHFATHGVSSGYIGRLFIRYEVQFSVASSKFITNGGPISSYVGTTQTALISDLFKGLNIGTTTVGVSFFIDTGGSGKTFINLRHAGYFLVTVTVVGTNLSVDMALEPITGEHANLHFPVAAQPSALDYLMTPNIKTEVSYLVLCKPATVNGFLLEYTQSMATVTEVLVTVSTLNESAATVLLSLRSAKHRSIIDDGYEMINSKPPAPALKR